MFDHQPDKPRHSTFQMINRQVGSGALMAANPDLQIVQYGQCGHGWESNMALSCRTAVFFSRTIRGYTDVHALIGGKRAARGFERQRDVSNVQLHLGGHEPTSPRREDKLIAIDGHSVTILDLEALSLLSDFENSHQGGFKRQSPPREAMEPASADVLTDPNYWADEDIEECLE